MQKNTEVALEIDEFPKKLKIFEKLCGLENLLDPLDGALVETFSEHFLRRVSFESLISVSAESESLLKVAEK